MLFYPRKPGWGKRDRFPAQHEFARNIAEQIQRI